MGKASRFLKALFGLHQSSDPPPPGSNSDVDKQTKRRWSNFFKSHTDKSPHLSATRPRNTPLRHQARWDQHDDDTVDAAAELVRMTSRATVVDADHGVIGEWAAVKIQSYFRAFLARKALQALKSLVKLQALVRGQIQRKHTADLRRYQAMVRAHARACGAFRFQISDSPQSTTKGPPTPEKFEHVHRSRFTKHNQPSVLKNNGSISYDDRSEKILEMDAMRPHIRRRNLFQPDQINIGYSHSQSLTTSQGYMGLSPSRSGEISTLTGPFNFFAHEEQLSYTTQNSSPFYPNSSKNGPMGASPFTPAKSDSSRSCLSGYSDHPNYMAYTESSRAKVRSHSAPRHRPNFELPSTTKRYSVYGYGSGTQRGSNMRDSFASKAYPGSGRLDRLGMPVGGNGIGYRECEYSGGYWN